MSVMRSARAAIFAFLAAAGLAHGTPTGLNNIPIADLVPHRKIAIQVFDPFG